MEEEKISIVQPVSPPVFGKLDQEAISKFLDKKVAYERKIRGKEMARKMVGIKSMLLPPIMKT